MDHRAQAKTISLKGEFAFTSFLKLVMSLPVGYGITFALLFLYSRETGTVVLAPTKARMTFQVVSRTAFGVADPLNQMLIVAGMLVGLATVVVLAATLAVQPLPVIRHWYRQRRSPTRETLWGLPIAALVAYILSRYWAGSYARCYIFSFFPTICALASSFEFAEAFLGGWGAAMWGHAAGMKRRHKQEQAPPPKRDLITREDTIPLKKAIAPPPDETLQYRRLLGLGVNPSLKDVRKAYTQRAKVCQVTMIKGETGLARAAAEKQMRELDEAYNILLKKLSQD